MIRSPLVARGTVPDALGSPAGPARLAVRHTRTLLVGLAVTTAIFADLVRCSMTPAQVPAGSPFPGLDD
jgi:hypothetical protein